MEEPKRYRLDGKSDRFRTRLHALEAAVGAKVVPGLAKTLSNITSDLIINKSEIAEYRYTVNDGKWTVFDSSVFKLTTGPGYNCLFCKTTGFNLRFGERLGDDPAYCALGPEILDLEISVNGCVPIPGAGMCRYCYKNNTAEAPVNMDLETFGAILGRFPRNLSQIAFGITGLKTNPDFPGMLDACHERGVVPNVTTTGADLDCETAMVLAEKCGAVAVSRYPGASKLCYDTIARLDGMARTVGRHMQVNMHVVLSDAMADEAMAAIDDAAEGRVPGLASIVFLRMKPVGRARGLDCATSLETYHRMVDRCMEKRVSFSFDSCSACMVMDVMKDIGRPELCDCCEPCESSRFSSYINVRGEYWGCSFAEGLETLAPIRVLDHESVTEWWNSGAMDAFRYGDKACESCPIYNLDNPDKKEN